jgi:LacI family transcriptional regulator
MHGIGGIEIYKTISNVATNATERTVLLAGAGGARTRILLLLNRRDEAAAAILRGIAQYQQVHQDWSVQVDERSRTPAELRWHLAQGWHGAISCNTSAALVDACAEFRLPLVTLDDSVRCEGVSRIRSDHGAVGAMGAECLLDRGFANLAFVGGEEEAWARERRAGFTEAVRLAHHEPVFFVSRNDASDRARSEGEARLLEWLVSLPKPLGVMAVDDQAALQVLEAARAAGLHVPDEVAVLGAGNDVAMCDLAVPSLSSVDPGLSQLGFLAAEHLHRRLRDPACPLCDVRVDPMGIVGRRTTDILAIPDRVVAAAVRCIAEHACEGVTVDQILPRVGSSRSQLERKFRRYLGRSPQGEIRRVQISRIRQLLADTDLPLKRIAELTGFEYMEYMCVVFRKLTGETMGAYRRKRRLLGCAAATENAIARVA